MDRTRHTVGLAKAFDEDVQEAVLDVVLEIDVHLFGEMHCSPDNVRGMQQSRHGRESSGEK